ncbi:MAG: DNA repair protein RecO [Cellvibrionaceae bacterium]
MSEARVQLQPSFVLHSRPFRDSSLLVDVLTADYGRISLIAKAQRQTRNRQSKPLHPFTELLLSWQGKSDLKSLTASETKKISPPLIGRNLYAGFYVNELLLRIVPQYDACPELYSIYHQFIEELSSLSVENNLTLEPVLRKIEFEMLDALGYGVSFEYQGDGKEEIKASLTYGLDPELGFFSVSGSREKMSVRDQTRFFLGEEIMAIGKSDFNKPSVMKAAKQLARIVLAPHIGKRPLKSRELFKRLKR